MKKGWYWPWFVGALLLATAAGQGIMLWAATHDDSMSIEPDYYNKGVAYDSVIAQRDVSARLGWRAAVITGPLSTPAPGSSAERAADVAFTLTDSAGVPVTGARLRVTAINNVSGARHVQAVLVERERGRYGAVLPLRRPGLWEFQVEAVRGRERFTVELRADVAVASGAGSAPVAPVR